MRYNQPFVQSEDIASGIIVDTTTTAAGTGLKVSRIGSRPGTSSAINPTVLSRPSTHAAAVTSPSTESHNNRGGAGNAFFPAVPSSKGDSAAAALPASAVGVGVSSTSVIAEEMFPVELRLPSAGHPDTTHPQQPKFEIFLEYFLEVENSCLSFCVY
jgi:hypothetical protein